MGKKFKIAWGVWIGCCLISSVCFASKSTYVIGVEDLNYYPQYNTTSTQDYVGYAREFFDAFAKSKGKYAY
ncbi:hypothetical protein WDW89_20610 [Deltaproteobacteria bacterium TL4]